MRVSVKKLRPGMASAGFAIPFFGMLAVMLVCGYMPFSSKTAMLYSDNYHQYYPFFVAFRRTLRSGGSLLYNWDVGMGVDFLGMIAYYLGSPLNLLSVLVPDGLVMHYYALLSPVKLGFAGLFFALFLQRMFDRDDFSVAVFGSFYALCAWALGYQWNIMWLDTFALLPLVMLGMDSLLRERKFILYTLSLFLSVFANYYIGLFTCFFVFLVFFCYEICRFGGWKKFFADLFLIGVFSLIAIGMTAVLSLSALAALQTTQSSVNKFPTGFRLNIAGSNTLLGLLDGMRQVAGNMGGGLEPTFKEGLPNLYCGVGSILLGILFLLSDEVKLRDKLCGLFLLLFFNLSFLIRQLDYIWHGFHFTNMIPYRFSFLHSFVLLWMAYRAWTLRKRFDKLQILASALLTGAVLCLSRELLSTEKVKLFGWEGELPIYIIYNGIALAVYTVILLCGARHPKARNDTEEELLRVRRIVRRARRRSAAAFLMAAVIELSATLTAFGCYFPGTGISDYPRGRGETASMLRYMQEREEGAPFFRAEMDQTQTLNDAALNGYSGISCFTSSANVHITEFLKALGYGAKNTYNRYAFEQSSPVANLFLNLKYMLNRDNRDRSSSVFEKIHQYGRVSLYRNTGYLPLGFLAERELADVDFLSSDDSFAFQNTLFRAATGIPGNVWRIAENPEVTGTAVEVNDQRGNFITYANPDTGANIIYTFTAQYDGFACIRLDLPKRNDYYVSINGAEQYKETISLPQMIAVGDVRRGDTVDIRILCKKGEGGTADIQFAVMDNDLFSLGQAVLGYSVMEITSFADTRVDGRILCSRDGLLYTSIPQNGNWTAMVDGQEAQITLVGDCMIGLNLTEGEHTLSFVYRNSAFALGSAVSLGCAAVFLVICLLTRKKKK